MKKIFFALLCVFFAAQIFSQSDAKIESLDIFRRAYPDVRFEAVWDFCQNDYLILVHFPGKPEYESEEFYWAGGRLLPPEKMPEKARYTPIFYDYPEKLEDPADMSEERAAALKQEGLRESRQTDAGSPMFFYDFLYDGFERAKLETHIKEIQYLGLSMKIHERLIDVSRRVEKRILAEAKNSAEVRSFLSELTIDAFFWRVIKDTDRKSFHSLGIAIDVLPKNLHGKQAYWFWAKTKIGENWTLLPFSERWMPPKQVIAAFEAEGFIWGGKWGIWDNMHFEYRPELILYNQERRESEENPR